MIRLGVAALLPPSHTLDSLEKAVDRAVSRRAEPDAAAAAPAELLPETQPPAPSVVGAHPLVRELALLPGLRGDGDEELRAVATSTARTFGAAVGMIWVERGQRSGFALHLEDAVPQRSPLRDRERWTPARSAIGSTPLFVGDVMQHEVLRRTPLLPDRSSATLLGAPLMVEGKTVGAVAILQPHVVGRLGRDLLRPLSFWAQRLSGDLQLLHGSAARRGATPASAPRPGIAESVADMLAVGLLVSDRAGIVCFANAALGRLLGAALPRWVGETRALVLRNLGTAAGADDGVVSAVVGAHDNLPQELEFEVHHPHRRILQWRARSIELASGTGILDELADVTVEAERARAKDALVRVDESTGLPNKEGAEDALGREVARALRSGVPFSVALFALDGAQTGAAREESFKQVAWLLRSTARRYDYVARLDALRLVAVLAETNAEQARAFARRFVAQVRGPAGLAATASAGIAQFDAGRNIQEILRDASLKLSEAKRLGGNRVA
jgi:GGDEF domain-containing protein